MCTGVRFTDNNNNLFFGRNLDVPASYGQKIMITPRNYKIPFKHVDDIVTTKAMIGIGITAGDYPLYFDAANENGLCIANLNFPKFATYLDNEVEGKQNITSYEFMTWILQNFDTVEEIKSFDLEKNLSFINTPLNEQMGTAPAHWLISDATASIVVEPSPRGVKVYDNPVGVLTNNPEFDWHLMNLNNYLGMNPVGKDATKWGDAELWTLGVGTGAFGMPGDWTPPSRFVKVAYVNHFYPTQDTEEKNVTRLFNTLKSVAMPEGAVDGEVTIYSSCYSSATKTYYFDTYNEFNLQSHTMSDEEMTKDSITIVG